VGIDEAEIAQRPTWSWMENRFLDDQILHLELSLSVTRLQDKAHSISWDYALLIDLDLYITSVLSRRSVQ
jgi:hypothetical protein